MPTLKTIDDFQREYGSVRTSDGAEWVRLASPAELAAAGVLALEQADGLTRVPVLFETTEEVR